MPSQDLTFSFGCQTDLDSGNTSLIYNMANGDKFIFKSSGPTAIIDCVTMRLYSEYNTPISLLDEYYGLRGANPDPIEIEVVLTPCLDFDGPNTNDISVVGEAIDCYRSSRKWPEQLTFTIGTAIE